jgi:hypothetical protein
MRRELQPYLEHGGWQRLDIGGRPGAGIAQRLSTVDEQHWPRFRNRTYIVSCALGLSGWRALWFDHAMPSARSRIEHPGQRAYTIVAAWPRMRSDVSGQRH